MRSPRHVLRLLSLLPLAGAAQDSSSETEELIALSPFTVSSDEDAGYSAASALAGAPFVENLDRRPAPHLVYRVSWGEAAPPPAPPDQGRAISSR